MSGRSVFFHVDLDAFFASVEQLDNPAYCGQPVIVGGMGRRGVVSTCSYEARKFGVHSAMPMMRARSLCPQGIFIQTRMQRYYEKSKEVMHIFHSFTPEVHQLSIDEAFLNMSGMETLFGAPENAARLLKKTIFEKQGCGYRSDRHRINISQKSLRESRSRTAYSLFRAVKKRGL